MSESFSSKWNLRMGQCDRSKLCLLFEYLKYLCSLLQSKTPALVFEYINNTDFKVCIYFLFPGMWLMGVGEVVISTVDALEHKGTQGGHW